MTFKQFKARAQNLESNGLINGFLMSQRVLRRGRHCDPSRFMQEAAAKNPPFFITPGDNLLKVRGGTGM